MKVIVPGKTLNEISKILSGEIEDQVSIFFSSNHIVFEFDDTVVVSRLIEGEYFRIDQMLSSDYETKVDINKRAGELDSDEVSRIREELNKYLTEGDLRREVNMNIKTKMEINCYQGTRHKKGLPVRGQRTNRNARTRKGKGKVVANKKK